LLDVDCCVVSKIDALLDIGDANFIGWRPKSRWGHADRIAGGTWLHRAGTLTHVWNQFSEDGAREARVNGYRGSDQAWLSYRLRGCDVWPAGHGIYDRQDMGGFVCCPADARIVHFNGYEKPWNLRRNIKWIENAWQ